MFPRMGVLYYLHVDYIANIMNWIEDCVSERGDVFHENIV